RPGGLRGGWTQVEQLYQKPGPRTGWWIVTACALAPNGVDPERLVQLATAALALDTHSDAYRLWLGAAQYRAGRFEQALRSLEAVTRSDNGWTNSEAWPLLAMTHHPLGHPEEARRRPGKARQGPQQATRLMSFCSTGITSPFSRSTYSTAKPTHCWRTPRPPTTPCSGSFAPAGTPLSGSSTRPLRPSPGPLSCGRRTPSSGWPVASLP